MAVIEWCGACTHACVVDRSLWRLDVFLSTSNIPQGMHQRAMPNEADGIAAPTTVPSCAEQRLHVPGPAPFGTHVDSPTATRPEW